MAILVEAEVVSCIVAVVCRLLCQTALWIMLPYSIGTMVFYGTFSQPKRQLLSPFSPTFATQIRRFSRSN